jgi:glutathione S-transferase
MTYTLYFSPGACSLSPHSALREAQLPFELVKVDLRAKKTAAGDDYLAISPKGYVPALRLPDGQLLTEGAVMVQYVADHAPAAQLAAPYGTIERYRQMEWLNFIATELHKQMGPFYSVKANDDYKQWLGERMALRWTRLAEAIRDRPFIGGERYSVVDGYACYVLRAWQRSAKQSLDAWPELGAYYARLVARPSIATSLAAEGIEP